MLSVTTKLTRDGPLPRTLDLGRTQVMDGCHVQIRGRELGGNRRCDRCKENPLFTSCVVMKDQLNGYGLHPTLMYTNVLNILALAPLATPLQKESIALSEPTLPLKKVSTFVISFD